MKRQLLETNKIDTVLDVGANSGQFGQFVRDELGYKERIISFEPLRTAFELLQTCAREDQQWDVFNYALGEFETERTINISANSVSSSMLRMLPAHSNSDPGSAYIGRETVEVISLDSIFPDLCAPTNRIFLKIDTQGFESRVLAGAQRSLAKIDLVQMEMSLIPLYEGEQVLSEMCSLMEEKGYHLFSIETGFSNPETGQVLQVDGIFCRTQ